MDEKDYMFARVVDAYRQCENKYMMTNTVFFDLTDLAMIEKHLGNHRISNYVLQGGYDEAVRQVLVFYPDHMDEDDTASSENSPIAVLRVKTKGSPELTHRDYLGAMMGLGVKREVVGDIIVDESGADIFVLKSLSDFFVNEFRQVGRYSITSEIINIDKSFQVTQKKQEINDTVASARLDNIISSVFKISRNKAQEAIKQKIVFVNNRAETRQDYTVNANDKLVLRGKGKVVFNRIDGSTKKGRIRINATKFL